MLDLVADDAHEFVGVARLFGTLRDVEVVGEGARAVAPAADDRLGRHEHARPGDDALVDRHLHADVGVAGPFGAEVTDEGEAGHQRLSHMIRRAGDAKRGGIAQDLVVPGGLIVRVQEDVRVRLDHPGGERQSGKVDDLRPRRYGDRTRRPDCLDLVVDDEDDHTGARGNAHAVPHARRAQQRRPGLGGGGRAPLCAKRGRDSGEGEGGKDRRRTGEGRPA